MLRPTVVALAAFVCLSLAACAEATERDRQPPVPPSASQQTISPQQEEQALATIRATLPETCEIGEILRYQPLPGWRSLRDVTTVIRVFQKATPTSERTLDSEVWLVPMDWVGIRIPGPFHYGKYLSASGFGVLKGCKVYTINFVQNPATKALWTEAKTAQLDVNENLPFAQKTFAGREKELDDEIEYLAAGVPENQRIVVVDSLIQLGVPARRYFLEQWRVFHGWDRTKLVALLVNWGDTQAEAELREALADAEDQARARAVQGVRLLEAARRGPYLDTVLKLAHDPSPEVRSSVVGTLSFFPLKQVQPTLVELLKDPDPRRTVQYDALQSLRKLGAKGYGKELLAMLPEANNKRSWVRDAVIKGLGEVGEPEAVPALLQYALDHGIMTLPAGDPTAAWAAVKSAYRIAGLKGTEQNGYRYGILTVKKVFQVDEPIHVFHIAEAMNDKVVLLLAGPLPVDDILDGQPAGKPSQLRSYDGPSMQGPGVAANYEVTSYKFSEPGRHMIQWRVEKGGSNILEIEVVKPTDK